MDFPIEIDVEDNKAHTQVAFLVDRPGFLEDIKQLRDRFQIKVPFNFTHVDSFKDHLAQVLGIDPKTLSDLDKQERLVTKSITDFGDNNLDKQLQQYEDIDKAVNKQLRAKGKKVSQLEADFDNALKEIRRKYRYPPMFDSVIRDSVLYGKVTSFKTAEAEFLEIPSIPTPESINILTPRDPYMVIVVTPYSTEKDIMEAFKRCCTDIREMAEWKSPVYQMVSMDTITNIKRDREWYWARQKHTKYRDILDDWNKKCPYYKHHKDQDYGNIPEGHLCEYCNLVNQNVLEQAVSQYKTNLNKLNPVI